MMSKKFALLLLLFAISTTALAQPGTGRIYGVIKDTVTGVLMESATVIIYKPDSTVALFKITDKNGRYDLSGLPLHSKYTLTASFAGYNDYRLPFTMDAAVKKMDTIYLQLKSSNEVVVTSIAPIRMNGDTLEINPAAFKMANDAVAEDLLNKVPGVVVWADGSITMNGKTIPKVLVDGKPFLGSSDHRIATQNLPKNIIDKIQVYNEVDMSSEANRSRITDSDAPKDSLLTMDIKLKADKKNGYFGKYGAGIGTDSRYQADAAVQFYNKQSTLSVGGGSNNINADIAGLEDIQRENTFRNNYATYRNRSNFGRSGINRVISPGIQFTHSFSPNENERKTNRLTGGYDYNNNLSKVSTQTYREQYLEKGDQFSNDQSENESQNEQHAIRLNYGKSLDYNKRFNVSTTARTGTSSSQNTATSNTNDKFGAPVSDNYSNSSSTGNSKGFTAGINYSNFDYDNPLKAIDANLSFSRSENTSERNENSVYHFYSPTGTTNRIFNRLYDTENGNTSLNSNLSYSGLKRLLMGRFNFFGIDISTSHNLSYNKNNSVSNVYDIDTTKKASVNNNLTYTEGTSTWQYIPSLSLNKNFSKWSSRLYNYYSIRATINKQFIEEDNTSSRANRNLNRNFSFLRFSAAANYNRQVTEKYRINGGLNYENGYDYPTLNQVAPVIDSLNLTSIYRGGYNLVNSKNHNLSVNLGFNTFNPKKPNQINFNLSGWLNNTLMPFADSVNYLRDTVQVNGKDSSYYNGKQERYTINGSRRYSSGASYNLSFSRKIKDNQIQVQLNGSVNAGSSPTYIDKVYSNVKSHGFAENLRFTYYYKTFLITGVSASASSNTSKQNDKNIRTTTFSGDYNVTVNVTKTASVSSVISYSKNNGIAKPITLWNANATYRFLKSKQAEVKFTATDILRQFKNISYTVSPLGNGVTTRISNGLQQYFMLTFSYFPRKFGGGKSKGNNGEGNAEKRQQRAANTGRGTNAPNGSGNRRGGKM